MSDPIAFRARSRTFSRRQVLSAAEFRSELEPLRETVRLGLACLDYASEEEFTLAPDALDVAAERYRVDRDLTTAEDTERWLADHELTVEDFTAWLERHAWQDRFSAEIEPILGEYPYPSEQVEGLLWAEVVFGDHLARLVRALAERVAVRLESGDEGEEPSWDDELAALEGAYEGVRERVLAPEHIERELNARRALLMLFDAELAVFPSDDAAREAWLCASKDGEPLEEVAAQAGASFETAQRFLDEFPADLQPRLLSAAIGEVLPPTADGEGFLVCGVRAKTLPENAEAPAVRERIEAVLMQRVLDEAVRTHIRWE